MAEEIEVNMGELKVAKAPDKLVAMGIGSCVAITFYDSELKVGALAHIMLPDSTKGNPVSNPIKYADLAVDEVIKEMAKMGSKKEDLEAKIVGGAKMFPHINNPSIGVGRRNIEAVRKKLGEVGIKLVGEAVGGSVGRSVEFSTATGGVAVRTKI
ncbi:MAG: chemotaxis protein CheD [Candidatus Hadarchaeota archaeon]|nr:chemotaxis protein CheD [Candidatus Hadarchaeota archaeon]